MPLENPLKRGASRAVISANIRYLRRKGMPQRQAVAAALSHARRTGRKPLPAYLSYWAPPRRKARENPVGSIVPYVVGGLVLVGVGVGIYYLLKEEEKPKELPAAPPTTPPYTPPTQGTKPETQQKKKEQLPAGYEEEYVKEVEPGKKCYWNPITGRWLTVEGDEECIGGGYT